MNEFRLYIEALVHTHRQAGGGPSPFINRLVNARVNGELMNGQQLIGYLFQLIGAGNDTTRNTLAGGVKALLEHPAELTRLCANPDLIVSACDELLRWTSPVLSFLRTTTRDFELAGTLIRAGDTVGIFYPSANRDERVFAEPYRFDIGRTPNDHLSFGYGAHFCLGTNLARAELNGALKALLPLLPHLQLADGAERIAHSHVTGYSKLPVKWVA